MEFSVSSTSQIRSAEAAHLGYMTKIMESMVTDIMICMTYWIIARISPGITGSVPIPWPARQRSPTTVRFNISIRDGPNSDMACIIFMALFIRSLLAPSNRFSS